MPYIELHEVKKNYGDYLALRDFLSGHRRG